jgi:hypothetical protein
MKKSLMAGSWLMDDDVPPPAALSNRSREALRAPVTLSFSAAHGCAQSFPTDAHRLSRAPGRWRMSSSSSSSSSTVVSPTNQRGDFSSSPSPAETRSASFPFSRIWLNAPRWVSEFFCQFFSCCQFSPPPDQTKHLLSIFIFILAKESVVACWSISCRLCWCAFFFLYFIFFCYEISVVATALQDWFGVLHKRIQLGGTPEVCVLSLRSGIVVTWV